MDYSCDLCADDCGSGAIEKWPAIFVSVLDGAESYLWIMCGWCQKQIVRSDSSNIGRLEACLAK